MSEYTENESNEIFKLATEKRDANQYQDALGLLLSIYHSPKMKTSAAFHAFIAHMYMEIGDSDQAVNNFKKSVEIAPTWDVSSLGLFHALWEKNEVDSAFEEIRRFTKAGGFNTYKDILRGIIKA